MRQRTETDNIELFNFLPMPLLEFNFSAVKDFTETAAGGSDTGLKQIIDEMIGKGELVAANRAALELYEADSIEELQNNLPTIIGDAGKKLLVNATITLLHGENRFQGETINYTVKGEELIIVLCFAVLPGYTETLERVLVTVTDITSSKKLERDINVLSLLPEANPNIVLILSCPGNIYYVNPAGRKWLKTNGFAGTESIKKLLPPQFSKNICGTCDRMTEQQYKTEYNDQVFDCKLKPIVGTDRCMITLTDVTEFERISRERILYYEAFQSSIHGMMLTDAEGNIEHINPKFEEIYGYNIEQARGKQPNILNPGQEVYRDLGYSNTDYENMFADMWKRIRDPEIGYWEGEIPNRRKDGAIIWVHLIINAIYCTEGNITNYLAIPIDISETKQRELSIRLDIYHTITELAEMRDNETGRHILRVGTYSGKIAEKLGMSKKFCSDIRTFAPLHDIGKVGISDLILLAERKLTKEEFSVMQEHTTLGYRLLAGKPTLEMAADIAYGHHEKWDGAGYPQGLSGTVIPLSARITAIVDVYDALRSNRPYKGPWTHREAIAEITTLAGSHFDPEVAATFISLGPEIETIAEDLKDTE
jgi:PAS domain S-box-containing protein